jgi:lipopolysaccharide export system protein LptA
MKPVRGALICLCWMAYFMSGAGLAQPAQATAAQGKSVRIKTNAASPDNREPINIQATKLDYFDKQQKLVYRGNVVAVRGDTTLKTPLLVVFLNPKSAGAAKGPPSGDSQVRRMEATGPVTIIAKDQIATGDTAVYEKAENKIFLNGNVTLSQGPNVTKGDHLVYDTTTGQAVVTGHVRSMFVPNNNDDAAKTKTADKPAAKTEP